MNYKQQMDKVINQINNQVNVKITNNQETYNEYFNSCYLVFLNYQWDGYIRQFFTTDLDGVRRVANYNSNHTCKVKRARMYGWSSYNECMKYL